MTTMSRRTVALAAVATLAPTVLLTGAGDAGAETIRSSGTAQNVDISWIEYDPDDLLGLPGNTHVGYLYAYSGQWGSYVGGNVTDFDCDPGEQPYGGHGVVEGVVDEGQDTAEAAEGDAIDAAIESGASAIDPAAVAAEVQDQLADEVTDDIQDEFEEYPTCDYIQDRFLEGSEATVMSFDKRTRTSRITGSLLVTDGHGEHGEPGNVLGQPPVDITITGGQWSDFTSTYSGRGADYRYSSSEKGTNWQDATVSGRIGGMGFDDDADDTSYGSHGTSRYSNTEWIR